MKKTISIMLAILLSVSFVVADNHETAEAMAAAGEFGPEPTVDENIAAMEATAAEREARQAELPTYEAARDNLNEIRKKQEVADENLKKAREKYESESGDPEGAFADVMAAQEEVDDLREQELAAGETLNQIQSVGDFVDYYQRYSGLSGWTSLIWDDSETLQKWRDTVNEAFCDALGWAPLSKECWTSEVCGEYSDITPTRDGVLFSTPVGGAPRAIAHVEAKRSLPLETPAGKSWVYTITFGLSNPSDKTMNYNVQFRSAGYTPNWWSSNQILGKGGIISVMGGSALIKHSDKNYGEVCLIFNPKIKAFDGKQVGKVCNKVVQASGIATAPYAEEQVEDAAEESPETETTDPDTPGASI